MKKIAAFLSLTFCMPIVHAAESTEVNMQQDGNIFYDANRYPNGIGGIASGHTVQMAMDANGVLFDQDESMGTRLRLMKNVAVKEGVRYMLWLAGKGFQVKAEKKRLQKKGDDRGYCSDSIFIMMGEEAADLYGPEYGLMLIKTLRDSTLQVVTPNLEVARLLKKLRESGHRIALLSNMGNSLLKLQAKALDAKIKSGELVGDELEASKFLYAILSDEDHNVVANSLTGNPHKPADIMYQEFLRVNRPEGAQEEHITILVDDKMESIVGAVKNGFIGILCGKCKAAPAMTEALPKLMGADCFIE